MNTKALLMAARPRTLSEARTCTPRDSFTQLDLSKATVTRSNIGGQGGSCNGVACFDTTMEDLLYTNIAVDQGRQLDLRVTNTSEQYDVDATIHGGGVTGQSGAMRMGLARSLVELDPDSRAALKKAGLLTRDSRRKESKKYGLRKDRKAGQ